MPEALWYGQECDYFVLATNLLGPSLNDLFTYCYNDFSLKTILLIADQAIRRLKHIHSKDLLHRDLKPDNMLMGTGKQGSTLYLIDFGLSKDVSGADLTLPQDTSYCGGSTEFASINYHEKLQQSRKDDLESLSYTLRYFLDGGHLPWSPPHTPVVDVDSGEVAKDAKKRMGGKELFEGYPDAFAQYHDYVRSLRFNEKPNYDRLLRIFKSLFISRGYKYDHVFDWTERMFRGEDED
ncbi:related to casein kinase-1 hhp1 [Cephalotrichum gorgonifer]|uniref:non-specific serine/threonine protein kinase n=1 Tax=Cephalotrichum gorgonifer TaxID=2041049 RepID=A0AAE8SVR4_9PEZI|nr:related to casein kinase-1 hhp1 [Cephalotrichum gorgonifer]